MTTYTGAPAKPNFYNRLKAIATLEAAADKMEAKRQAIYELVLQELDEDIIRAKEAAIEARNALKAETLAWIASGGNPDELHGAVTFQRRAKLMYDKREVLAAALEHDEDSIIRRRALELDVREFERLYKNGELEWAQVEVVHEPTIAISGKLGDFLILSDEGGAK